MNLLSILKALTVQRNVKIFINDYSLVNEFEEYCNDNDLDKEMKTQQFSLLKVKRRQLYEFCNNENYTNVEHFI